MNILNSFVIIFFLLYSNSFAQNKVYSLEECIDLAKKNYPLIKEYELIEKSKEYKISNLNKGFLPQVNIYGSATYQSDVTSLGIKLPGVNVTPLSNDQYKLYGEISQVIYDGGAISNQKKITRLSSEVEKQKLEVDLYQVKDRILDLFLGTLNLNAQIVQFNILLSDLDNAINKAKTSIDNGIILKNNLNILKAERLKASQKNIELINAKNSFISMLSYFINDSITENDSLIKPNLGEIQGGEILRPEISFFDKQLELQNTQRKMVVTENLPKLSAVFTGGLGRPALNFLSNNFELYYVVGARLVIPFSGFYSMKTKFNQIELDKSKVNIQKENFIFNTNIQLQRQNFEINKYKELLELDEEIISIQTEIKNVKNSQLENGIIDSNDYLKAVNDENSAIQNKIIHEIQLIMANYKYKYISGN